MHCQGINFLGNASFLRLWIVKSCVALLYLNFALLMGKINVQMSFCFEISENKLCDFSNSFFFFFDFVAAKKIRDNAGTSEFY